MNRLSFEKRIDEDSRIKTFSILAILKPDFPVRKLLAHRLIIFFILISQFAVSAFGNDPKYPVSEIPETLRQGANAIIRENSMTFSILTQSTARAKCLVAITILNERAKDYARDYENYDKLTKLSSFEASSYDAAGSLIKKLKANEFNDRSVYDGVSLFSDDRVRIADITQSTYPYTVVFEYEFNYRFLFFIPSFEILPGPKVALQQGSFTVSFPQDLAPRYKLVNTEVKPLETQRDGETTWVWSFSNVIAIKTESFGKTLYPAVVCAPGKFEFDGYVGRMNTWDEFGYWIQKLNKGRDVLPEETKLKIKKLTEGLGSVEEKSRAVYNFVQSRSRYVSIQLGIGGFQPFEAEVVDRTGYGDCKALSNYTVALLREVGVKANYVLISAGENARVLDEKFPSSQFNHATVCVPNGADSLWLECTSQTAPFGYAGTFTGDRHALAITENGAKVVRTTTYPTDGNTRIRRASVTLDAKGNALAKIATRYTGLKYEEGQLDFVLEMSHDIQQKWIERHTDIKDFTLQSFSFEKKKERIPSATVTIDLVLNRLASVSGKRFFLTPNLMSRSTYIPEAIANRRTDVIIKSGHIDSDTIRFDVPEILYPESLPTPISITSRFGEYKANFELEQGRVVYTRTFKMSKGTYAPETFNELVDFFKKVAKADNTKIVFINKT